jgi:hypothetical protein
MADLFFGGCGFRYARLENWESLAHNVGFRDEVFGLRA